MDLVSLSLSLSLSVRCVLPLARRIQSTLLTFLLARPSPLPRPATSLFLALFQAALIHLSAVIIYIYLYVYTYSNLIKGVKAEISSELVSSKLVEFLATLGRKNPLFPFFSPFLASFVVFFWLGGERGERSRSNFRGEWSRVTTLYTCARVVISVWREKEICTQLWLYSF